MSFYIYFTYIVIFTIPTILYLLIKNKLFRFLVHARRKYPATLKIAEVNRTQVSLQNKVMKYLKRTECQK